MFWISVLLWCIEDVYIDCFVVLLMKLCGVYVG